MGEGRGDGARVKLLRHLAWSELAMRVTYDPEADVLYLRLRDATVDESEEVAPNLVVDLDEDGRAVGIEIGAASRQLAGNPLSLSVELLCAEPAEAPA
jgi:uncharacterized protein YuzE